MEPRLMKESLEDYTRVMRGRYTRRTGKLARSVLLDEYCQTTGLDRKYANKVLRGQRRVGRTGASRGRAAGRSAGAASPPQSVPQGLQVSGQGWKMEVLNQTTHQP